MNISIIVSIYNIQEYVERCLKSVIETDERIKEIICVNDGSTDNSMEVVEHFSSIDSRIQIYNKKNGGISSARNLGIEKATGDWLLFVDGDDYIFPDELGKLIDEIEPNIDALWTGYIREDWTGVHPIECNLQYRRYERKEIQTDVIPAVLGISYDKLYAWFSGKSSLNCKQEFPSVWHCLFNRKIIEKYNIQFNENVITGEDLLFLWTYFANCNRIEFVNHKYYCYVWRKGSLTEGNSESQYLAKGTFIKERDRQNEFLIRIGFPDFSPEYQGSLVLTKIQMALLLSKCSFAKILKHYHMYRDYCSYEGIRNAYKGLKLKNAPAKYKVVLQIAKWNWNFILFACCYIANLLKLHIYPDE